MARWLVIMTLLLGACATDVHDLSLAKLDLNDQSVVQEVADRLPRDERAAFATYRLFHWPGSNQFCGKGLKDEQGRAPQTVGEAIAETRIREALLQRERERNAHIPTAAEKLQQRQMLAVDKVDQLTLQRDMLFSRLGPDAGKSREWAELDDKLDKAKSELARLRNQDEPERQ